MARLILFNKPFGVLSQFTDKGTEGSPRPTLSGFIDEPGFYPAGRLDRDSEGLMVLTDDGKLQARISNPRHKMAKTYLVQVEGTPTDAMLEALRQGIALTDGPTRPAKVGGRLPRRTGSGRAIRRCAFARPCPMPGCALTITEGRNRQVRRMTAHVGLPCLRLIRVQIGDWALNRLAPGAWRFASADGR